MAIGDKIYIADKPTLDEVKSNIGATADTGGTTAAGGIFAKLNAILQQFLSNWTAVRAAKLDGIGSADDTGGTATTGTVMGKLNALFGGGAIKSIQRGVCGSYTDSKEQTVTISEVNTSKSIVLLSCTSQSSSSYGHSGVCLLSFTPTTFSFKPTEKATSKVSWQVIEFY